MLNVPKVFAHHAFKKEKTEQKSNNQWYPKINESFRQNKKPEF